MEKYEQISLQILGLSFIYFIVVTYWSFTMTQTILGSGSPAYYGQDLATFDAHTKTVEFERTLASNKMSYFSIFHLILAIAGIVLFLIVGYVKLKF